MDLEILKKMDLNELKDLSQTIRSQIINAVSDTGGHIASSLGAVELAIALHYVFDSPEDTIIWDVGHQAYAHKILTGRDISGIRTKKGVSGFPKPKESIHDPFIAGHAGISISQASAVAKIKKDYYSIAVIGDGSMTAGIAYEALNHAGSMNLGNLIVVLNDNEMSISKNVGAISSFINKNIVNSSYYQRVRSEIKGLIESLPLQKTLNLDLVNIVKKIRSSAVSLIAPESFFEAFGFRYVGPFDGNDVEVLVKSFKNIPSLSSELPVLFHVITKKGKGFHFAEENPCTYHGVSSFDKETGKIKSSNFPSFTNVMGDTLVELARENNKICAITAAMKEGTGLCKFEEEFPDRFFDVGIAEQHAVTFASGLAKEGIKPVVAIYSTFLQRSFGQLIHDIALNGLSVVFCVDRAGIVGEDGATHHGMLDLSYLRTIPNINIMAPASKKELRSMLKYSINSEDISFIRYPRGSVPDWELNDSFEKIEKGKFRLIYKNNESKKAITIFAVGYLSYYALLAAKKIVSENENISIKVYDVRFIKPIDKETIINESNSKAIITIEDNSIVGGFGSEVLETLMDNLGKIETKVYRLGASDNFIHHGSQDELRQEIGIDTSSIYKKLKEIALS